MKISIIHASRSRPEQASEAISHWIDNMSGTIFWEYILSLDTTDPTTKEYPNLKGGQNMRAIFNDNKNAVQAFNAGGRLASGDIVIAISDDFRCFKNWDVAIVNALEGKSGLLKTFDGVQKWICTLPIFTKDYLEEVGSIYNPTYEHQFCDTQLTHIADITKKLIVRNDIVFKHDHYSVTKTAKDAVTKKADSTWDSGKRTYLRNCKNKFGLGIDIFNLSPEAHQAGHVAWLKKELRRFR